MFSQHSRRHSNNTNSNSDLSDDELFLPDDNNKSASARRSSQHILASPTHRKLTPTHIRSTGSSPSKRISKMDRTVFRSLDAEKDLSLSDLHTHYETTIADMKHSHEETVKHLKYKLRALENPQNDEEYLVSGHSILGHDFCLCFLISNFNLIHFPTKYFHRLINLLPINKLLVVL